MINSLDTTAKNIHAITRGKGFWDGFQETDPFSFYAYKLAMIHSEVTETLEAIRKDEGDSAVVLELADILIRVLDFYEGLKVTGEISDGISLDKLMDQKMVANMARPQRHGVRG